MKLTFDLLPKGELTAWHLAQSGATLVMKVPRFPHRDKFFVDEERELMFHGETMFNGKTWTWHAGACDGKTFPANAAFNDGIALGLHTEDGTPNSRFTPDSIYAASGYWWNGERWTDEEKQ